MHGLMITKMKATILRLEAEKSEAWETCQKAVERGMKLERDVNAITIYGDSLKAENQRLRELVKEAGDAFEAASEGSGVNFHAYALDMKAALQEGE